MSPRMHVVAPTVGSLDTWQELSSWHQSSVTVFDFAEFLGLKPNSLQQNLSRGAKDFPTPTKRGWRNLWTPAQVYTYCASRPHLRPHIPRLYPQSDTVSPSIFVAAEQLRVPSGEHPRVEQDVVVHYWQPGDGRQQIAIAYFEGAVYRPMAEYAAANLMHELQRFASAVAVVTDDRIAVPGTDQQQPVIVVAEPPKRALRSAPHSLAPAHIRPPLNRAPWARKTLDSVSLYDLGWVDVAGLLHTNLPWWPQRVRSIGAFMKWHPDADTTATDPRWPGYDPSALGALVADHPERQTPAGTPARELAARLTRQISTAGYPVADDVAMLDLFAAHESFPGITLAADSSYRCCPTDTPDTPVSVADVRWLLTQPHPHPGVAERGVSALEMAPQTLTLIADTVHYHDVIGDFGIEWLARLIPAPQPDALGFAAVRSSTAQAETQAWEPLHDPLNPAIWILRAPDGSVSFTVGIRVPAAGRLQHLQLEPGAESSAVHGFFRDADGTVWPLPVPERRASDDVGTATAHAGALATVINALLDNAGGDIPPTQLTPPQQALEQLLATCTAPVELSSQDLMAATQRESPATRTRRHRRR